MGRDYRIRTAAHSRGQYVCKHRWDSAFVQPTGKQEKRQAARRVRKFKAKIQDGSWYKRIWGPFEWS